MKKTLAFLLSILMMLSMAACGGGTAVNKPMETTEETKPVDTYPYPAIQQKLTWDAINAFPIKNENMTVQEMRELCVAFMRFSKTAMWTPNADVHYVRNAKGVEDDMFKGTVYAGLPYVGLGTGNVYRMMDHLNEETGVMDMTEATAAPKMFGNQCSCTTYWAWGRVINSFGETQAYTANMTQMHGYLRVGPYTYPDNVPKFSEQHTTKMVCDANGIDVMCQSYAQMHLADGMVQYSTAGHTIMVSSEPHVEYYNGSIDPTKSYVTILEQAQTWEDYTNEAGDKAQVKNSVDKKMTFMELFNQAYLPFTYAEFLGTKGIDKTECSVNISGDTVEQIKLFNAKITANFGISDAYISLKDANGKEVYRLAVRATHPNVRTLMIQKSGNVYTWGDFDKLNGEYAVELSAQLSTGERPVLYTGKVNIQQDS